MTTRLPRSTRTVTLFPYSALFRSAWLLLLPLALTSTQGWIRRLGRNWGRLHKLVYAAGVLVVLHFWWLVKSDIREPALYAAILAALLGWRTWKWLSNRRAVSVRTRSDEHTSELKSLMRISYAVS